jgi:hypothetical protein
MSWILLLDLAANRNKEARTYCRFYPKGIIWMHLEIFRWLASRWIQLVKAISYTNTPITWGYHFTLLELLNLLKIVQFIFFRDGTNCIQLFFELMNLVFNSYANIIVTRIFVMAQLYSTLFWSGEYIICASFFVKNFGV